MFYGRKENEQYGFFCGNDGLKEYVELTDSEHMDLVVEANEKNKIIVPDENGYPILSDPPPPSEEEVKRKRIEELEEYLSSTDWYVVRQFDDGKEMPTDIKTARESARQEISELREELEESQEEYSELPSNEYDENGDYIGG